MTALANARGKPQRQFVDELGALGSTCGLGYGVITGTGCAIGNVFSHGAIGQKRILRNIANSAAQVLQVEPVDGLAIQQDAA